MEPFVFTELTVKGTLLNPAHFKSKPGPQFLKACRCFGWRWLLGGFLTVFLGGFCRSRSRGHSRSLFFSSFKDVSVVSDKDVIALVVKGGHLTSSKLGIVREQTAQKAACSMTQSRREPIQDQFWNVTGSGTMVLNVGRRNDVGHLEKGGGTGRGTGIGLAQMRDNHAIAHF
eukprot:scaffold1902_cov45-Attheya_sp.AAC.1